MANGIVGKATVELINKNTGEVEQKIEHENFMTNALSDYISLMPKDFEFVNKVLDYHSDSSTPLLPKLFGNVFLLNETLDADPNHYYMPENPDSYIGWANQNEYSGNDLKRGSKNALLTGTYGTTEEYKPGWKFVWDFAPERANGEIKTICLGQNLCVPICKKIPDYQIKPFSGRGWFYHNDLKHPNNSAPFIDSPFVKSDDEAFVDLENQKFYRVLGVYASPEDSVVQYNTWDYDTKNLSFFTKGSEKYTYDDLSTVEQATLKKLFHYKLHNIPFPQEIKDYIAGEPKYNTTFSYLDQYHLYILFSQTKNGRWYFNITTEKRDFLLWKINLKTGETEKMQKYVIPPEVGNFRAGYNYNTWYQYIRCKGNFVIVQDHYLLFQGEVDNESSHIYYLDLNNLHDFGPVLFQGEKMNATQSGYSDLTTIEYLYQLKNGITSFRIKLYGESYGQIYIFDPINKSFNLVPCGGSDYSKNIRFSKPLLTNQSGNLAPVPVKQFFMTKNILDVPITKTPDQSMRVTYTIMPEEDPLP